MFRDLNFFLQKQVQTSTNYAENHSLLARDSSDCKQHEFRQVCIRKKITYHLTFLNRLSRYFYLLTIRSYSYTDNLWYASLDASKMYFNIIYFSVFFSICFLTSLKKLFINLPQNIKG